MTHTQNTPSPVRSRRRLLATLAALTAGLTAYTSDAAAGTAPADYSYFHDSRIVEVSVRSGDSSSFHDSRITPVSIHGRTA